MLARAKLRPWTGVHIDQYARLPGIFRMRFQEWPSFEIRSARMAYARDKSHGFGHVTVHHFSLYSSERIVWKLRETRISLGSHITVAAKRAPVGPCLFGVRIVMVGKERLRQRRVDFALIRGHQFIPANMASVRRSGGIRRVESCFVFQNSRIACKI